MPGDPGILGTFGRSPCAGRTTWLLFPIRFQAVPAVLYKVGVFCFKGNTACHRNTGRDACKNCVKLRYRGSTAPGVNSMQYFRLRDFYKCVILNKE